MIELLLGIVSMSCNGIAVLLIKKGLDSGRGQSIRSRFQYLYTIKQLFSNKFWFSGGFLLVIGWLFRFIAVSIADLSYIRMIFVLHLLIVVIGSRIWLKERTSRSLLLSTTVMLAGLLFLSLSPPLTRNAEGNPWIYLAFLIPLTLSGIGSFIISLILKKIQKFIFGICSAIFYALGVITQGFFAVNILKVENLFDIGYYLVLLSQPILYLILIFALLGFLFSNLMLYKFQISVGYSFAYPFSEIIVLFGSIIIFGDDISIVSNSFRFIGILCIFVGLLFIIVKYRNELSLIGQPHVHGEGIHSCEKA